MQTSIFKQTRVLALAALAGVASLASQPVLADLSSHYAPGFLRHAERAMQRGAPERALAIIAPRLEGSLKSHDRAEAQGIVCRAKLELGSLEEARQACISALDLDGTRSNWRFLNNLGVAEMQLGNFPEAEQAFSLAAARSGYASVPRKNLNLLRKLEKAGAEGRSEQIAGQLR